MEVTSLEEVFLHEVVNYLDVPSSVIFTFVSKKCSKTISTQKMVPIGLHSIQHMFQLPTPKELKTKLDLFPLKTVGFFTFEDVLNIKNTETLESIILNDIVELNETNTVAIKHCSLLIHTAQFIINTKDSFKLLSTFKNIKLLHLYCRASISTVDMLSTFFALKSLTKVFIHTPSHLLSALKSSVQYVLNRSIKIVFIVDYLDSTVQDEDLNINLCLMLLNA
ncbi:hypothetical protein EIN_380580, partial [Entamoeba invadens IP1]